MIKFKKRSIMLRFLSLIIKNRYKNYLGLVNE